MKDTGFNVKQFIEGQSYQDLRVQITLELNNGTFYKTNATPWTPFHVKKHSFERFEKTLQERIDTKNIVLKHKNELILNGYNPKKDMNIKNIK